MTSFALRLAGLATAHGAAFAQMPAETVLLPEVSVTAAYDPVEVRRNASTAKIVYGREDIESMDAGSVGELLRRLPGSGLAADMENRRGRGKGADRFLPTILVDGEPLPGGDRNPATALRLAPELIERIEVMRSPGAEYPAAGPGGIINLVLRDVPPRPTGSMRGAFGAQGGGAALRLDGQHGQRDAELGWLLAGSAGSRPLLGDRHTDIQRFTAGARTAWNREESRERGREDSLMLAPRVSRRLDGGTQLVLSPFLAANRERRDTATQKLAYADPAAGTGLGPNGTDREHDAGDRDSFRLVAEWRAVGAAAGPWNELLLRTLYQGEREDKRKTRREYDAAGTLTGSRDEAERRSEREVGLAFKGKRLFAESHLVGVGAEWRLKSADERKDTAANGVAATPGADGASRQRDRRAVLWVQDEWQLADRHLLTAGVRFQAQRARLTDGLGATTTRATRSADPSLHYLWQPEPAWNLRAGIARDKRVPGMKDLSGVVRSASGVNSSGNPDKAGNPSLRDPETLNLEAGVEHFLPTRAGSAGVTVFRRRIDNQVQKLTLLDGARWIERPYNVGTAVLTGGTFDLKSRLDVLGLPGMTLRANYSTTRTRLAGASIAGGGEGPRTGWNLGFDYEMPDSGLSFGANLNHVSALDRESSVTVRQIQGARRQVDLYARQRLDRQLALRLSVSNLTHPDRLHDLRETDAAGLPTRLESDREIARPLALLTLEVRW